MVKFRNRIVHVYWEVGDEVLYDILQNRLDDFNQFAKYLSAFIEKLK